MASLFYAATAKQVAEAIEAGANIRETCSTRITPFFNACKNGNLAVVTALHEIYSKLDPEDQPSHGICYRFVFINLVSKRVSLSPIDIAAYEGNYYIVEFLISKGYNYENVIFFASWEGHMDIIHYLFQLKTPPDVNKIHFDEFTSLQTASFFGKLDVVNELLYRGAIVDNKSVTAACTTDSHNDVETRSILQALVTQGADIMSVSNMSLRNNSTILNRLSKKQKYLSISFLIDMGANVNALNQHGVSALMIVCGENMPDAGLIKLFIDRGADLNYVQYGQNLLQKICLHTNPNIKIIRHLINGGIDLNYSSRNYGAALQLICSQSRNSEIAKLLIDSGADVNYKHDGKSLLQIACSSGNPNIEIIRYLINGGIDLDYYSIDYEPALLLIFLKSRNIEIVKLLINSGANVNLITRRGDTALLIECKRKNPNIEIIKLLIDSGAHVNSPDNNDETALHYVCEHSKNIEVVRLLIDGGADVNVQSCYDFGRTALHKAVIYRPCIELIKLLVENGANADIFDHNGKTALHYVCGRNHNIKEAKFLIESGANVNACSLNKKTALYEACTIPEPNVEVIELLINSGANINHQNSDNKTALHGRIN